MNGMKIAVPGLHNSSSEEDGSSDEDRFNKKRMRMGGWAPPQQDAEPMDVSSSSAAGAGAPQSRMENNTSGLSSKRKINNVWGAVIQELDLDQELNKFSMNKQIDMKRGVENYLVLQPGEEEDEEGEGNLYRPRSHRHRSRRRHRRHHEGGSRGSRPNQAEDHPTEWGEAEGGNGNESDSLSTDINVDPTDVGSALDVEDNERVLDAASCAVADPCQGGTASASLAAGVGDAQQDDGSTAALTGLPGDRDSQNQLSRKRTHAKSRLGQRDWDLQRSESDKLQVTADTPQDQVVTELAHLLQEPKLDLIERCVKTLGVPRALELYFMTEDVELKGGMLTMDGGRRRTPGGVYLQLLKVTDTITPEEKKAVFLEEEELKRSRKLAKRRAYEKRKQEREQQQAAVLSAPQEEDLLTELPTSTLTELDRTLAMLEAKRQCILHQRPADCGTSSQPRPPTHSPTPNNSPSRPPAVACQQRVLVAAPVSPQLVHPRLQSYADLETPSGPDEDRGQQQYSGAVGEDSPDDSIEEGEIE